MASLKPSVATNDTLMRPIAESIHSFAVEEDELLLFLNRAGALVSELKRSIHAA